MLSILYLGTRDGNSGLRAEALRRLGHRVELLDPWGFLPAARFPRRVISKFVYELGPGVFEPYMRSRILRAVGNATYDLVWVGSGELLGPSTITRLREVAPAIVNYNNDDPFGTRDRKRFALYREAVPRYDLLAVVREVNVEEAYAGGARNVLRVYMSADEVAHAPIPMTPRDQAQWAGDVVFVGTWMPERGPFFARLIELDVPLRIHGDRWNKAAEWPAIRRAWAGPAIYGADYVKAIQGAKMCLGLLSKGNRDQHTRRSAEVPYIGGVLCAERTPEHLAMYDEDKEAVFWSTPEECAEKCRWLLREPALRQRIARAGRARCIRNGLLNEQVNSQILKAVFGRLPASMHSQHSAFGAGEQTS